MKLGHRTHWIALAMLALPLFSCGGGSSGGGAAFGVTGMVQDLTLDPEGRTTVITFNTLPPGLTAANFESSGAQTATGITIVGNTVQVVWDAFVSPSDMIRVNGVAPGGIATALKGPASLGMDEATFPGDQLGDMAADYVPLGILPTPEDYAGAYVFFANRQDNIPSTGTILNHDGGFAARGLSPTPRGGTLG